MSKQIISTPKRPPPSASIRRPCASAIPFGCPARSRSIPRPRRWCSGDIEAQIRQVFDNLKAIVDRRRRQLRRRGQSDGVPHRSVTLRAGQQGHGRILSRALSRARGRRRGRAAARRAGRSGVHRRPVIAARHRSRRCAASATRSRCGCARSASRPPQDLLFLLPLRYEDRTRVVPLGELRPGSAPPWRARCCSPRCVFRGRRQMLCRIADGSGFLTLRFFYFTAQQQAGLARGARMRCFGECGAVRGLEMVHPEYRRVDSAAAQRRRTTSRPSIRHRGRHAGSSAHARRHGARSNRGRDIEDWLPADVLAIRPPGVARSLDYVHRPPADAPVDSC